MKKLLILALTASLTGCFGKKAPEKTGFEGKPIPSFKLLLTDSSTYFNTQNIPAGKPIVLFCFGPYCPYSRAQMEEILNHMKTLKDARFYIFTPWPFADMKAFYNYYQLNKYPNILTGTDYSNFFGPFYRIKGVPYTAIYGRDRKLIQTFTGEVFTKQIKSLVE